MYQKMQSTDSGHQWNIDFVNNIQNTDFLCQILNAFCIYRTVGINAYDLQYNITMHYLLHILVSFLFYLAFLGHSLWWRRSCLVSSVMNRQESDGLAQSATSMGHYQQYPGPIFYLCLRTYCDSKNLISFLAKIISFSISVLATRS